MAVLAVERNKTTEPAEQEIRQVFRRLKAAMAEILLAAQVAAAVGVVVLHKQALVQQIRHKSQAKAAMARPHLFLAAA